MRSAPSAVSERTVAVSSNAIGALAELAFGRALLRGTFTLRSGAVTDRYFDKYRVTCDPALLGPVADALADLLERHAPGAGAIVAPELGAVPLAAALSLRTGLPVAIVRSSGKAYGTSQRIEGVVSRDVPAVLVEDVVTSGGAALEALGVARAAGMRVERSLCVLDRGGVDGGARALSDAGVPLAALFSAADLDRAFDAGIGVHAAGIATGSTPTAGTGAAS